MGSVVQNDAESVKSAGERQQQPPVNPSWRDGGGSPYHQDDAPFLHRHPDERPDRRAHEQLAGHVPARQARTGLGVESVLEILHEVRRWSWARAGGARVHTMAPMAAACGGDDESSSTASSASQYRAGSKPWPPTPGWA